MTTLLQLLIFFLAIFTQTLTGFGAGLVSMAFLPALMPMRTAAPVVALVTSTLEAVLLIRYRGAFNFKSTWPLIAASLFGIPIGVWALRGVPETALLRFLGFVMAGYASYSLFNFRLPELKHPIWAFVFGFAGGILSGAYSVGGPPVIIYGNCRRWQPDEFRSNLQGYFLVNDAIVLLTHGLGGNLTPIVWQMYLLALPMIGAGIIAGGAFGRRIDALLFRKLTLWLLVLMGIRLILVG